MIIRLRKNRKNLYLRQKLRNNRHRQNKKIFPDLKIGKISTNFKDGDLWFFVEVRNEGDTNSCAKDFKVRLQGFTNKNYVYDAVLPKAISLDEGGKKIQLGSKIFANIQLLTELKA